MPLVLKRFLLPASLLLTVSACGIGDWFGEAEAPPLPGERIAILAYERGLRADPELAELVVQLPEPYVNAYWAQPGGSAAHAMYHLSLSANPSRVWSVDVGDDRKSDVVGKRVPARLVLGGSGVIMKKIEQ